MCLSLTCPVPWKLHFHFSRPNVKRNARSLLWPSRNLISHNALPYWVCFTSVNHTSLIMPSFFISTHFFTSSFKVDIHWYNLHQLCSTRLAWLETEWLDWSVCPLSGFASGGCALYLGDTWHSAVLRGPAALSFSLFPWALWYLCCVLSWPRCSGREENELCPT